MKVDPEFQVFSALSETWKTVLASIVYNSPGLRCKTCSLCGEVTIMMKYKTKCPPPVPNKGKKNAQIPGPEASYNCRDRVPGLIHRPRNMGAELSPCHEIQL